MTQLFFVFLRWQSKDLVLYVYLNKWHIATLNITYFKLLIITLYVRDAFPYK